MRQNGLRLSKDRYNWEVESTPLLQRYGSLAPMSPPLSPDGAPVE